MYVYYIVCEITLYRTLNIFLLGSNGLYRFRAEQKFSLRRMLQIRCKVRRNCYKILCLIYKFQPTGINITLFGRPFLDRPETIQPAWVKEGGIQVPYIVISQFNCNSNFTIKFTCIRRGLLELFNLLFIVEYSYKMGFSKNLQYLLFSLF